ncbi:MAG: AEC family transporter [Erysipelotrichaceae bacterium]|nr:AEC family transporter [Erysipelotrichaceae bacterium]
MTGILINTQITILTYLSVGFILYKIKMIDNNAQLFLTELTLSVLLPFSVFVSFVNNMSVDLLVKLSTILIFATAVEIVLFFATKIPKDKLFTKTEQSCVNYGLLVSNGALIGSPVIESLFGPIGVMYCNVFLIPIRILAYSAGESFYNPSAKKGWKDIARALLTNKILDAMFLSFFFIVLNITIPAPVLTAFSKIGAATSPMSLILVGSMLAQKITINLDVLKKVGIITGLRLIVIPLFMLCICKVCGVDFETTAVMTLLMGMPVGSTCATFAKKYRGNEEFASLVVFFTTILSTGTLVLLMRIIEMVF